MHTSPPLPFLQGSFTVEPGRAITYTVRFAPSEDSGPHTHELRLRVAHNPYEDYRVALTGEGYQVGGWVVSWA